MWKIYTHEELQTLIKGEIIGDTFPYDKKNESEIESYLKQLYYRIKRIPNLICQAEFDHFGSGYASFVEFFCYRKEDVRLIKDKEKYGILEYETSGILLNVCRLAPVFIYGEDERYERVKVESNEVIAAGYSPLPGQTDIFKTHEKFDGMMYELLQVLQEFNYEELDKDYANKALPFRTKIPTLYREAYEYRVLDALFYWED